MQKPAADNGPRPQTTSAIRQGLLLIRRLGRTCFWHDPALYRWFGRMHGRGDCLKLDFDVWIDGFPGSANVLAAAAFRQANPAARLGGNWHSPPFILNALYNFKPGIFLLRQPADAVITWAILSKSSLVECLDYYNDFHRVLWPQAPWLFVVAFEDVMTQFATVMDGFNLHYRTGYAAPAQNPAAFLAAGAQTSPRPDNAVGELRLSRPVARHSDLKHELRRLLHESPRLRGKLERAREFYSAFVPPGRRTQSAPLNLSTRHLPSLA